MRVSVIGVGKLGTPMLGAYAKYGHQVIGVDNNPLVVARLAKGKTDLVEPGLKELLAAQKSRIQSTSSVSDAVQDSQISFVVVPTPSHSDGSYDISILMDLCEEISLAIENKQEFHLVVICSTISPTDSANIYSTLKQRVSNDEWIGYCYSPEFVALGNAVENFLHPEMYLIGEIDSRSGDLLEDFYISLHAGTIPVFRMSTVNAELAKIALNSFVTMKITFANLISDFCEELPGGQIDTVTEAIGFDSRIGNKYLRGGLPFGGPCFPRDNAALASVGTRLGINSGLLRSIDEFNNERASRILGRLEKYIPNAKSALVVGLAYKFGSDTVERSAGLEIALALHNEGLKVKGFEPSGALSRSTNAVYDFEIIEKLGSATEEVDIIVLASDGAFGSAFWKESLIRDVAPGTVILDCWRSCPELSSRSDVTYLAIGLNDDAED